MFIKISYLCLDIPSGDEYEEDGLDSNDADLLGELGKMLTIIDNPISLVIIFPDFMPLHVLNIVYFNVQRI